MRLILIITNFRRICVKDVGENLDDKLEYSWLFKNNNLS